MTTKHTPRDYLVEHSDDSLYPDTWHRAEETLEAFDALLEACETINAWARKHPWTGLGDAQDYRDGVNLLKGLKAAITKARD